MENQLATQGYWRIDDQQFYIEDPNNFDTLSILFNSTSRFTKLQGIKCALAGRNLYICFKFSTWNAMGMNTVSKGVQNVLDHLQVVFLDMHVISISGNFCANEKATTLNWIERCGKLVVCDAILNKEVVTKVLKRLVSSLTNRQ